MTEINDMTRLGRELNARPGPRKAPLIGVGALLVTLTNAVIFVLPPLLPIIQAQYGLATVSETTWLYTALTLAGQHGATAAELQARAGHASQAAMAIYQHATIDRDKSLADRIGATYEAWRQSGP